MKPCLTSCRAVLWGTLILVAGGQTATGQNVKPETAKPTYGHSMRGEAFNEGPRQRAYLMRGMAKIVFPITTRQPKAQRFFEQGVSQLHGYWYYEAERSFRQAATLDPDCAMAYWGMAMAHDEKRAKEFIQLAMERRSKVSERERMWIETLAAFHNADPKMENRDKKRRAEYIRGLERIVAKYPNDIEAKAFLAHDLMETKDDDPKRDPQEIDRLMKQVLAAQPNHPVHHYRIHLWDSPENAGKALDSAAECGYSAPGIAHLWHMEGHIYSQRRRYADAAFSQEASARVDHAYMIRDQVMPYLIHNYGHNNQWCAENLIYLGRVRDAIALSRNLLEIPRHPRSNSIEEGGQIAGQGRMRLLQALWTYEQWAEALELDKQGYLEPTSNPNRQQERLELLAAACYRTGDHENGNRHLAEMERRLAEHDAQKQAAEKEKKTLSEDKSKFDADDLKEAIANVKGYAALSAGNKAEAGKWFEQVKSGAKARLARLDLALGQTEKALTKAQEAFKDNPQRVDTLATLIAALVASGKREEAKQHFAELRTVGAFADLDLPLLTALAPLAKEFGYPTDWRSAPRRAADIARRPQLERLGPFRWSPFAAPEVRLADADGKSVSLSDFARRKRPVLVLFYLGNGCERCMQQLNAFAPLTDAFTKAGISVVAVSPETPATLRKTYRDPKTSEPFPFPLLADPSRRAFQAFRAYDDQEKMPLHGVYLLEAAGRVRWQDIRFEPFTEVDFLLAEAKRLLGYQAPLTLASSEKGEGVRR